MSAFLEIDRFLNAINKTERADFFSAIYADPILSENEVTRLRSLIIHTWKKAHGGQGKKLACYQVLRRVGYYRIATAAVFKDEYEDRGERGPSEHIADTQKANKGMKIRRALIRWLSNG